MQEAAQRLGQLTRPEDPAQAGTHTGGTAPDAGERQEDFEELIRGRYKADFDARVKKILDGRLRGLRQEVTDLRQREKLRQVQIQYYLDRLPEQERILRLPAQRKKIYAMSRFGHKSSTDISACLGLSVRTVENHLFISRKEIREYMKQCI